MVENDTIIEIKNLTKSFGEVKAVNGISLKVNKGELFAFLGVNGAGKSTTIDIMCGLLARDGGKVVIDGVDIDDDMKAVSSKIGVVFQNSVLDGVLTVRENLIYKSCLVRNLRNPSQRKDSCACRGIGIYGFSRSKA